METPGLSVDAHLDEQAIKAALVGDGVAQSAAIRRLYDRYSRPLTAFIREKVAPTLGAHEISTAVNNVFIDLARRAREGQFSPIGSMRGLLFDMARKKGIDQLRKEQRWTKLHAQCGEDSEPDSEPELVFEQVAKALSAAPEVATAWKNLTQSRTPAHEAASRELIRVFKLWIGTLPPLQRKVAQVMIDHFGDVTNEQIRQQIGQKTGVSPKLESVKSARAEIRAKFSSLMTT